MVIALWRYYNMWRFWSAVHQIGGAGANGARASTGCASETVG
jgi:hypothetical protein